MRKKLFLLLCLLLFPVIALAGTIGLEIDGTTYNKEFSTDFEQYIHDGSSIKVVQYDDTTNPLIFTKPNLIVDINGKSVSMVIAKNGGTFALKDTLKTGSIGTIKIGADDARYTTGNFTIEDTTFGEIEIYGKVNVNIKNSTMTGQHFRNHEGNVTIDGGNYGDKNVGNTFFNGFYNDDGANLTIEDGTFYRAYISAGDTSGNDSAKIVIKNGTFNNFDNFFIGCGCTGDIYNGKFTSNYENNQFISVYGTGVVNIKNVTYTGIGDTLFFGSEPSDNSTKEEGTINMYEGTITLDQSAKRYGTAILMIDGTFNFYGGKIIANNSDHIKVGHFNFGKKSATPNKATPILELRKGHIFMYEDSLNFYGGTMYLKEQIDGYKSEVNLYDLIYEKQSDGSFKAYLKSATNQELEEALWNKYKKAFKSNDVLSALKKDTSKEITIKDNGSSISYTVKD